MLPALYYETKKTIKSELDQNIIDSISLTADLWTSRANESYLVVTGYFITEDFQLKSILLNCSHFEDSHSSENIETSYGYSE